MRTEFILCASMALAMLVLKKSCLISTACGFLYKYLLATELRLLKSSAVFPNSSELIEVTTDLKWK